MPARWTPEMKRYVLDNCHLLHDIDIAARLTVLCGRPVSVKGVRRVRYAHGVEKACGRGLCKVVRRADLPDPGGPGGGAR